MQFNISGKFPNIFKLLAVTVYYGSMHYRWIIVVLLAHWITQVHPADKNSVLRKVSIISTFLG